MDDTLNEFVDELKARNAQLESELAIANKKISELRVEIEKAYDEGVKHASYDGILGGEWQTSQAKKVMDGKL